MRNIDDFLVLFCLICEFISLFDSKFKWLDIKTNACSTMCVRRSLYDVRGCGCVSECSSVLLKRFNSEARPDVLSVDCVGKQLVLVVVCTNRVPYFVLDGRNMHKSSTLLDNSQGKNMNSKYVFVYFSKIFCDLTVKFVHFIDFGSSCSTKHES